MLKKLKEVFQGIFGIPLPESPMADKLLVPLTDNVKECLLFGSEIAAKDAFLIQGSLSRFISECPEGYFLIGFWGHGINSHAFYYSRVDSWSKVLFRLGYGGAYMDNALEAKYIKDFLIRYFDFERKISGQVKSFIAIDSMDEGYYSIELPDGKEYEIQESLLRRPNFDDIFNHPYRPKEVDTMITKKSSWLWPHLESILKQKRSTLLNWRKQIPTQQGRVKNFENWVLVELVNKLIENDEVLEVRTNGHFTDKKISVKDVENHLGRELKGSKSSAKNLSADISVKMKKLNPVTGNNFIYNAEIKTGLSPLEILNDLLIVKYYSEVSVADKAEFGWVVLLPEDEKAYASSLKTYKKICEKIETEYPDFTLLKSDKTNDESIIFCVAIHNLGAS
ncbi:MAG TPA: hypothetical protein PLB65_07950 [Candidatus Cloacimonas sp.]|jgi:hypothetical protein|nr:MAG: hypothetical protein BWX55_00025 [Deltaproteobacteria bacterium ADurb.Bin022]HOQ78497.1 hypothetical protein [Candidatus Cloacimonas sp.]HPA25113.1 hypothetical protein [Candidatus Cloacimonas sp.]HPM11266.1 hypothetical protein [Paludibacter sp.]